jgi:hypothetical protein
VEADGWPGRIPAALATLEGSSAQAFAWGAASAFTFSMGGIAVAPDGRGVSLLPVARTHVSG